MNPIEELVNNFQHLVAQVPEVKPFVVMLAGAIPFIDGEVGPSSARRRYQPDHRRDRPPRTTPSAWSSSSPQLPRRRGQEPPRPAIPQPLWPRQEPSSRSRPRRCRESKGRLRLKKWLARYGVPGAIIFGPLAIPAQFTSAILVVGGTPRAWVLLWQAIAIALWTTIATISAWLALQVVG